MEFEVYLKRWLAAGLINEEMAERIRAFESTAGQTEQGIRWPTLVALVFGAILLCAGVLLFVSAHWDELSPGERMTAVLAMVAVFHGWGAWAAQRYHALAVALHTAGTFALGAGIALTGQIFHLSEHWPAAVLLWAMGAAVGWAVLGHWTQGTLVALLVPYWIGAEWVYRVAEEQAEPQIPLAAFACLLSLTYLSAPPRSILHRALIWIGAIAVIPSTVATAVSFNGKTASAAELTAAWAVAIVLPLGLAWRLRGGNVLWNLAAAAWVALLTVSHRGWANVLPYVGCAVGAAGLTAWGVQEGRVERINLGMAGFAITVLTFYFSDVMDKLDRSLSLILLGILFLGGGWMLERMRRRLVERIRGSAA